MGFLFVSSAFVLLFFIGWFLGFFCFFFWLFVFFREGGCFVLFVALFCFVLFVVWFSTPDTWPMLILIKGNEMEAHL